MFKEALKQLILNDDGTIDAPVIEPAAVMPDAESDTSAFEPKIKY